jgi:hypothetical protein
MNLRDRFARRPTLHFILAGGLLFGALRALPARDHTPLAALRDGNDDALLLHEALALRLDDTRTVRGRLVELAESLGLAGADPTAREREARALGLERSDPVLQRHMIELMRLAAGSTRRPPDEATLRTYYQTHAARFASPERVQLTQIYLSPARRGAAAASDAAALLARLRSGGDADAALELGDSFGRVGPHLGASSRAELARTFGAAFADVVFAQPAGEWRGPIASSYGLHLVRVETHLPAEVPDLARVRSRVLHAYLRERGADQLRDALAALRTP